MFETTRLSPRRRRTLHFGKEAGRPSHALSLVALAAVHVSGSAEALQLALVRPNAPPGFPGDPSAVRARDTLEPVSAIVPIHSCSPTCSFSPRAPIRKCRCAMSPQCVRSCEGSPSCPRERRRARAVSRRQTHRAAPFCATCSERCRFTVACGRSPGFSVDRDVRRSSRPIPRRPVKSAACPGPKNLPSKSAFSSAFRLSAGAASCELALTRGAGALPEMAISCASHRRVTGRFRVRRHRDSARWRRPVEIPVHASWKPELPVRASLDPTVTGVRAALLRGAGFALRLL